MADPMAIGQIAQGVQEASTNWMMFVDLGCYLLGMFLGVLGALRLKQHNERRDGPPLSQPLILMMTAGLLVSMPTFLSLATDSAWAPPNRNVKQVGGFDAAPVASSAALSQAAAPAPSVQARSSKLNDSPAVPRAPTFANSDPAIEPEAKLAKEPSHGGAGDFSAMAEILCLFAALGLGGWAFVKKMAAKAEARNESLRSAMAGIDKLAAPSEQGNSTGRI